MSQIESLDVLTAAARELLVESGLLGALPTPIHELVDAAGLTIADASVLDHDYLKGLPPEVGQPMLKQVEGDEILALLRRDSNSIHLNPSVEGSSREPFTLGHEIGHKRIKHHEALGYAETKGTLSPSAHRMLEREANQFSAELIFQLDALEQMGEGRPITFETIKFLNTAFGTSIQATFRRFVETHSGCVAGITLDRSPVVVGATRAFRRREAMCSAAWADAVVDTRHLPKLLTSPPFGFVDELTGMFIGGKSGDMDLVLKRGTIDGRFEVFDNGHKLMVLLEADE